jgi:hypothetical protein
LRLSLPLIRLEAIFGISVCFIGSDSAASKINVASRGSGIKINFATGQLFKGVVGFRQQVFVNVLKF